MEKEKKARKKKTLFTCTEYFGEEDPKEMFLNALIDYLNWRTGVKWRAIPIEKENRKRPYPRYKESHKQNNREKHGL